MLNRIQSLGIFLRTAREFTGLSQTELGEQVGNCTSYINLIENDRRIPSSKVVKKICTFCQADYNQAYLLWRGAKENSKNR